MKFTQFCEQLEAKIQSSYTEGVTLEVAEKLAAEFLHAGMVVSAELKKADLSARMRKSGVKAVRAAFYLETCSKLDKKPTENALDHMLSIDTMVQKEQDELDAAEVLKSELERYYNIFQNAHIFYRGVAKGNFNG